MKRMILITMDFPFGEGETFLEAEVTYYSEFDRVLVYTLGKCTGKRRDVPDFVTVGRKRKNGFPAKKRIGDREVITEICRCLQRYGVKKAFGEAHLCQRAVEFYSQAYDEADRIAGAMSDAGVKTEESMVIYAYWMLRPALVAALLRERYPNAKLVTRCHGGDLYEERDHDRYLPFRKLIFDRFDLIVPISANGKHYLQQRYGKIRSKVRVSRLGVQSKAGAYVTGGWWGENGTLKLISCSNMIPVKRLERIVEVLSLITDIPIEWKHFGDGGMQKRIKELSAERLHGHDNIKCRFMGRVSNQEMLAYYAEEYPHVLINTSASEGIPVSMMEAMSYGIPVIGTDVGGVREIVTDGENGYLVSGDFDNKTLAAVIRKFYGQSEKDYCRMSEAARETYRNRYDAKRNYSKFVRMLSDMI